MLRVRSLLTGMVLAVATQAPSAAADVPDPNHSSVDRVLSVCPEGDLVFTVVARGFAGTPKAGVVVQLVFGPCGAFPVCPDQPGSPTPYYVDRVNRYIQGTTNAIGVVQFPIRMGGTCPDSLVAIYGDGILFAHRSLVSPDQNGDLGVDAADLTLLEAKLGGTDPTGDFDGDGIVTAADVAAFQTHLGHVCPVSTRARPATWGRLKLLYR
jgi:hypothetical protein